MGCRIARQAKASLQVISERYNGKRTGFVPGVRKRLDCTSCPAKAKGKRQGRIRVLHLQIPGAAFACPRTEGQRWVSPYPGGLPPTPAPLVCILYPLPPSRASRRLPGEKEISFQIFSVKTPDFSLRYHRSCFSHCLVPATRSAGWEQTPTPVTQGVSITPPSSS